MSQNDKDPVPAPVGNLSPGQLQSLLKMEPKTLGAIQVVIGGLILCLSASVLQVHEVHFTGDVALFLIVVVEVTLSGSVLIHSARRPTLLWVKVVLILHLISAAFATAALGLMSKHLPYRQDSYHCEHCRRLELHAVLLIDGILCTLVIFLVLELLICITAMLFGLSVLAAGGTRTPSQRPTYPQSRPPHVTPVPTPQAAQPAPVVQAIPAVHVAPAAAEPSQQVEVVVTEPDSDQVEDISTPPTEPQVEPIEAVP
ncbi:uncharacterized protein LOC121524303 isoform X3 [Cheilinus undulatus]|uniref:uncharacterized protein LOC121524303 isoform X3 n=1 Tax=Cheilinus undulatus TaxID=241271 RepID=UPI001BD4743B|nr:uncharacterized protein LOC121524303 isoform X3 [Cheilinus undulatus]